MFLCFALPAVSSTWQEVCPMTHVELTSIKTEGNYIYYWAQFDNDGKFEDINGKYVNYSMNQGVINCFKNQGAVISSVNYDKNGGILDSYFAPQNFLSYKFVSIPAGSKGQYLSNFLCKNYKTNPNLKMFVYNPNSHIYHQPECIHAKSCTNCMEITSDQAKTQFHAQKCSKCFKWAKE